MGPACPFIAVTSYEAVQVIVVGCVLVVVIVAVGVPLGRWLRREFHPSGWNRPRRHGAFSAEELESMRASGELSDEEFRALRRAAMGLDAKAPRRDNSASSSPAAGVDVEVEDAPHGEDPPAGGDKE